MEKTLGQERVNTNYNLDNELELTAGKIKVMAIEFIDLIEELRTKGCTGERHRAISKAQTDIETASFFGVKAVYTK